MLENSKDPNFMVSSHFVSLKQFGGSSFLGCIALEGFEKRSGDCCWSFYVCSGIILEPYFVWVNLVS